MPLLDDNLRDAPTQSRCLDLRDLSGAFWMLQVAVLQDCGLVRISESAVAGPLEPASGGAQEQTYEPAASGSPPVNVAFAG